MKNLFSAASIALLTLVGAVVSESSVDVDTSVSDSLRAVEFGESIEARENSFAVPKAPTADCRDSCSCSHTQIQLSTLQWRLAYLRTLQTKRLAQFNASTHFGGVEGQLVFFSQYNYSAPNTWTSHVNAALIHGIQGGVAALYGLTKPGGSNPSSTLFANFLRNIQAKAYRTVDLRNKDWCLCEQAATNYGKTLADKIIAPTLKEKLWFKSHETYRWVLQNKGLATDAFKLVLSHESLLNVVLSGILSLVERLVSSIVDITNPISCYSFYRAAAITLDASSLTLAPVDVLKRIVPKLV